jgi:hypothetical protein
MAKTRTNEGKLSKMIDDRLNELENEGEDYDAATKGTKISDDSDDESDEELPRRKGTTKKAKMTTAADEDDVSAKSDKKMTTARANSTKTFSRNGKNSTITNKSEVVVVPRINIDGTQIAFKQNATNSTQLETTTERELGFHDIVNLISPNRNKSEEGEKPGEHGKFTDEKGGSANLKFSFFILFASFAAGFYLSSY